MVLQMKKRVGVSEHWAVREKGRGDTLGSDYRDQGVGDNGTQDGNQGEGDTFLKMLAVPVYMQVEIIKQHRGSEGLQKGVN